LVARAGCPAQTEAAGIIRLETPICLQQHRKLPPSPRHDYQPTNYNRLPANRLQPTTGQLTTTDYRPTNYNRLTTTDQLQLTNYNQLQPTNYKQPTTTNQLQPTNYNRIKPTDYNQQTKTNRQPTTATRRPSSSSLALTPPSTLRGH